MDESISASDANREFSRLLRGVRDGNSYVVTSHGRPVARLIPVADDAAARETARQKLLGRWRRQAVTEVGPWSRDELYERGR